MKAGRSVSDAGFCQSLCTAPTFVIAGDRFAIGSSREISGRHEGWREEVGLEMVVVCGNNMGDIFRRNAFNLGLHVVQSPEAVTEAQEGDRFAFDPLTRRLTNETQGKTYDPIPLTPKEDEIRRTGGIIAIGALFRRLRDRALVAWPDPISHAKTTTEQIVGASRRPPSRSARARVLCTRSSAGVRWPVAVRDPQPSTNHLGNPSIRAARDRRTTFRLHRNAADSADVDRARVRGFAWHRQAV